MRFFVYCVFRNDEVRIPQSSRGIRGRPLTVISTHALAAAVSMIEASETRMDLNDALIHHKVIASFHKERTVIPMRFGTLLDERAEIERLLDFREEQYRALLEHIDGCVELGIKIIAPLPPSDDVCSTGRTGSPEAPAGNPAEHRGIAYLNRRKTYYSREHRLKKCAEKIVEGYRRTFAGLFRDVRVHALKQGSMSLQASTGLFSLSFLVARTSLQEFEEVFHTFKSRDSTKMLLTGPWPPYNFVSPEEDRSKEIVFRDK